MANRIPLLKVSLNSAIAFPTMTHVTSIKAKSGKVATSDDVSLVYDMDRGLVEATSKGRYLLIPVGNVASMEPLPKEKPDPIADKVRDALSNLKA